MVHTQGSMYRVYTTCYTHTGRHIQGVHHLQTHPGRHIQGVHLPIYTQGGIYRVNTSLYTPREVYTRAIPLYTPRRHIPGVSLLIYTREAYTRGYPPVSLLVDTWRRALEGPKTRFTVGEQPRPHRLKPLRTVRNRVH